MKYCIIIPDGAADYPVDELGERTPLETARIPNMDRAAEEGLLGQINTVPKRMAAGSSVAIMSILGYNPQEYYTGRAPLEAADMGVDIPADRWGIRCNFITVNNSRLEDFSAGHISTEESDALIESLNEEMGSERVTFHTGTGYRNLLVYKPTSPLDVETNPPHQVMGEELIDIFPTGRGSEQLVEMMRASQHVLENHEVNDVRRDLGQNPANMIWLWGQGRRPNMETFADKFGVDGGAISAVNLVKGIARLIGWDIIEVPGITGFTDTDYGAKGRYAIDALNDYDIVLVHVEAPDEASHEQDPRAKVRAIEQIDQNIVGPVMAAHESLDELKVMVLPDHITSVEQGRHSRGMVPIAMWGTGIHSGAGGRFDEAHAGETDVVWEKGHDVMRTFLHK